MFVPSVEAAYVLIGDSKNDINAMYVTGLRMMHVFYYEIHRRATGFFWPKSACTAGLPPARPQRTQIHISHMNLLGKILTKF